MLRLTLLAILAAAHIGAGGEAPRARDTGGPARSASGGQVIRRFSLSGTPAVVVRPPAPTGRLVLYLHGASETAEAVLEEQVKPLTDALLARGFAVAASTGGSATNWGDPTSVADSVALVRHLGYKRIYIIAQSMGGIGGIELIDKLRPVAWAGIFPVCDARSIWDRGSEAPEIEAAWGPGPPPASISPAKAKHVAGMPALIFASPHDTVVPIGLNADVCAAWMNQRGAHAKVIETVGDHGDQSNFQPARLANFFSRAG